ncbi:TetR/AcrR family transcriptional regulator [Clostridium sp. PL3]|uniref:TetR/AcrR family transcriptional regulator n=1 Tax=Clostridium thailandense TaxID=2794346 RepID=A0A949U1D5_9CLOT|nr:TetR/AcrR family transcriptional regulator [Clostridium thailandense]MBV7275626.1 TetR/AcrR family transcriptional regulator [Clostridium thailandense]
MDNKEKDIYEYRHLQASQTRDKIFTTATELFNELGFDKVTIREICKKAEVALGTFYLHFKSKHEILYDIYHKADNIFEYNQISERKDLDVFEKIIELIKIQLSISFIFHLKSDAIKQLYAYQLESDNKYFLSEDRKFFKQLNKVVEDAQLDGEIRKDISSHDISWRILRFSRGIIFDWCLHNCDYDIVTFGIQEIAFYLQCFRNISRNIS